MLAELARACAVDRRMRSRVAALRRLRYFPTMSGSEAALDRILDRHFYRIAHASTCEQASRLLQRLVNEATRVLARCQLGLTEGPEQGAPFGLFYHLIEMIDGAEVHLERCVVAPAIPSLRSAWEAALQLEFLFETDFHDRASGCLAAGASKRRANLVKMVAATPAPAVIANSVQQAIIVIDALLANPRLASAITRIAKTKAWYQAYGGGASIEQLAQHLKHDAEYQILYRQWSSQAHATDLHRMFRVDGAQVFFEPMRSGKNLREAASLAATILLRAIKLMLDHYRPDEQIEAWYLREIRDDYVAISEGKHAAVFPPGAS